MSANGIDLKDVLDALLRSGRDLVPGRERIQEALGLAAPRGDGTLATLGVFGAGVFLGAGIALLLAPRTGAETRRVLGERVEELRDTLGGGSQEAESSPSSASRKV